MPINVYRTFFNHCKYVVSYPILEKNDRTQYDADFRDRQHMILFLRCNNRKSNYFCFANFDLFDHYRRCLLVRSQTHMKLLQLLGHLAGGILLVGSRGMFVTVCSAKVGLPLGDKTQ